LGETPEPLLKQEATSQPGNLGKGKEEENGMEVWSYNFQSVVPPMTVCRLGSCLVALLRVGRFWKNLGSTRAV